MQIAEGRQDLDRVRERVGQRHRPAALPRVKPDLLQRLAAHVLHHDVPGASAVVGARVLDEVVDPHDVGVLDLGEELTFGDRRGHRVCVPGVEQPLEHDPSVAYVAVAREIHPAESAVREAAGEPRTARRPVPRSELGAEGEAGTALPARTLLGQAARRADHRLADPFTAVSAELLLLSGTRGSARIAVAGSRATERAALLHQPGSERAARSPAAAGPRAAAVPRLLPEPAPVPADHDADPWPLLAPLEPLMALAALRRAHASAHGRVGLGAADRAVPVLDHSAAPRLCACGSRHRRPPSLVVVTWIAR